MRYEVQFRIRGRRRWLVYRPARSKAEARRFVRAFVDNYPTLLLPRVVVLREVVIWPKPATRKRKGKRWTGDR